MENGASIITIDGPNASGKGSLGRRLAEHFDWPLLDTGLMYRAAGAAVVEAGVEPENETACEELIEKIHFELRHPGDLFINGEPADLPRLRGHEAGDMASRISAYRKVRDHVHHVQRAFADQGDVIIDGRDIGTVVAPQARYKFFLTASPEVRAKRRVKELAERGVTADYETILADVKRRDERDAQRQHDPMHPATDALIIDTSNLAPDEVFRRALGHIESKRNPTA